MSPAIEVSDLRKTFGRLVAVDGISFSIEKGEFVGLVGPNGSGKTTTLLMISGLVEPTSGFLRIGKSGEHPLSGVGCVIGTPGLYGNATPRELLTYVGRLFSISESNIRARTADVLEKTGMTEWADSKMRKFSKGMKQRTVIAQALMNEPEILLLDEPASGLDPAGMRDISKLLKALNEAGTTILLSSHMLEYVGDLCDRVIIMDHGKVVKNYGRNISRTNSERFLVIADKLSEEDIYKIKTLPGILSAVPDAKGAIVEVDSGYRSELLGELVGLKIGIYAVEPLNSLEDSFFDATGKEKNGF